MGDQGWRKVRAAVSRRGALLCVGLCGLVMIALGTNASVMAIFAPDGQSRRQ